jgi:hypothetical protein
MFNRLIERMAREGVGKATRLGIKTNAEQALICLPGLLAALSEGHRRIVKKNRVQ